MELAARLDDYGKWAWIAVTVLGFIVFWPIGLAILAYLIWSGRMGFWKCGGAGRWENEESRRGGRHGRGRGWRGNGRQETSGNVAFDEYREETLRRLEEEQKEFRDFLERLRHAKDKAEFDAFMTDRRNRPAAPDMGAAGAAEGPVPQPRG
jgi:hypothetical protein